MFGRLYGNTYGSRRKELERASSISQAQIDEAVKIVTERTGEREKMVAAREKNVSRIVEAAEAAISCIEDEKPKLAKALRQKIDDALNGRVGTY